MRCARGAGALPDPTSGGGCCGSHAPDGDVAPGVAGHQGVGWAGCQAPHRRVVAEQRRRRLRQQPGCTDAGAPSADELQSENCKCECHIMAPKRQGDIGSTCAGQRLDGWPGNGPPPNCSAARATANALVQPRLSRGGDTHESRGSCLERWAKFLKVTAADHIPSHWSAAQLSAHLVVAAAGAGQAVRAPKP